MGFEHSSCALFQWQSEVAVNILPKHLIIYLKSHLWEIKQRQLIIHAQTCTHSEVIATLPELVILMLSFLAFLQCRVWLMPRGKTLCTFLGASWTAELTQNKQAINNVCVQPDSKQSNSY